MFVCVGSPAIERRPGEVRPYIVTRMDLTGRPAPADGRKTRLQCPCGELIAGETEDDLVEKAFQHLRDAHPHLADEYTREHVLFMAY